MVLHAHAVAAAGRVGVDPASSTASDSNSVYWGRGAAETRGGCLRRMQEGTKIIIQCAMGWLCRPVTLLVREDGVRFPIAELHVEAWICGCLILATHSGD